MPTLDSLPEDQRRSFNALCRELQLYHSWDDHQADIDRVMRQLEVFQPDMGEQDWTRCVEQARKRGQQFKVVVDAYKRALEAADNPCDPSLVEKWRQAQAAGELGRKIEKVTIKNLRYRLSRLLDRGQITQARQLAERASAAYPFGRELAHMLQEEAAEQPPIVSKAEHAIFLLEPCPAWTLVIDETGDFKGDDDHSRIVGVLFPDALLADPALRSRLPDSFHGAQAPLAQTCDVLNAMLAQPCGILGFSLGNMHRMQADRWFASVMELVNWVWRLLPLPTEGRTRLTIAIEQRGEYQANMDLKALEAKLRADWDKADPARRTAIELAGVRFMDKTAGRLDVLADALAYCWGAPRMRQALKQSRLTESCLLDDGPALLPVLEQAIAAPDGLTGEQWRDLLARPDADNPRSLTRHALNRLRERGGVTLWRRYRDFMRAYLDGKAYDLKTLERMSHWLFKTPPEAESLTAEDEFLGASVRLAALNHQGVVGTKALKEVMDKTASLAPRMGVRHPDLELQAALRLAVADANAFDFAAARARLDRWNPQRGGRLPGLAEWDGKIWSSLGQAAAFEDDHAEALRCFDEALRRFVLLEADYPDVAYRQASQTLTYAAIAAMDAPNAQPAEIRRRLERIFDQPLAEILPILNRGADPARKYQHHLALRYLVAHGAPEERQAYAAAQGPAWLSSTAMGYGHPWPLIQYYRAQLVQDAGLRRDLLESALKDVRLPERGYTVKLIGLAIALAGGVWTRQQPEAQDMLRTLQAALPHAAARLALLADPAGPTGHDLFTGALPFNYR